MRIFSDVRLLARGGTTGISGYTHDLHEALFAREDSHAYTLFYNAFRKAPLSPSLTKHPQVTVHASRTPNRLLDLSFRTLNRPIPRGMREADLVFSPHFTLLPRTKTPQIITFHDLSFLHNADFFSRRQQLWHWLQAYKKRAKAAAHIISVSDFTKQDLVSFLDIPEERITTIYSGVNEALRAQASDKTYQATLHKKYQFEHPFFLFLGTIEPRKNITSLIRAFSFLKEKPLFKHHRLVIAGRKGFGAESVIKEANASPFARDIIFLHNVPDEDRAYLYSWARVFIYPSFFEGFGFPPLEAQVCNTPVIAGDRTSLPEILQESALYFNPWSVSELVTKLESVETSTRLRNTLIRRGAKNAATFTWEQTAKATHDLFAQHGA